MTRRAWSWLRANPVWIGAIAISALVIVTNLFVADGAALPLYWEDEAGYLGNAQVMAGVGSIPDLSGRPYYIGWSLLLVPLWWILGNGQQVYLGAVALSTVCGILVAVPLTLIARRLGLSLPWAIIAGGTLCLASARALYSGFAMSENLLSLAVAFSVLFAIRFRDKPTLATAMLFSFSASMAFLTHGRAVPVLAATVIWLVLSLRRSPIVAVAGIVTAGVVAGGGFLLYRHVTTLIYGGGASRESIGLGRLFGPDPLATVASAVGQIWYVVFVWVGLTVLGLVALFGYVRAEFTARRPGPAVWAAVSLLGVCVISFTFIAAAIARGASRLDIYSYGRYLDPFVVPLALVGIVMVIRVVPKRVAWGSLIAVVAVAVAWFVVVYPRVPSTGAQLWFPINIMGTLQFPWRSTTWLPAAPWLYMAAFVIAAFAIVAIFRKRPALLVTLLVVYFVASTAVGELRIVRPFFSGWNTAFTLRETIAADPLLDGKPVALDTDGLKEIKDSVSKNAYQTLLAPTSVTLFDSESANPPADLVIARKDWARAGELGARKIADDTGMFSNALWVLPGELQNELDAAGELVPTTSTTN